MVIPIISAQIYHVSKYWWSHYADKTCYWCNPTQTTRVCTPYGCGGWIADASACLSNAAELRSSCRSSSTLALARDQPVPGRRRRDVFGATTTPPPLRVQTFLRKTNQVLQEPAPTCFQYHRDIMNDSIFDTRSSWSRAFPTPRWRGSLLITAPARPRGRYCYSSQNTWTK